MSVSEEKLRTLRVGDTVEYRGCWGRDEPRKAKVSDITICAEPGEKHGTEAQSVSWEYVRSHSRAVLVGLAEIGAWGWGFQCSPYLEPEEVRLCQ